MHERVQADTRIPKKSLKMYLRNADAEEAFEILKFYREVIESIRDSDFRPKWNDLYPNLEFIKKCIEKEELYICCENNIIISSAILNNTFDNDYSHVKWLLNAEPDEIMVVHTFAINPQCIGKGYGKKIFEDIKSIALENNQKTIRIDVINGNIGAQNVFKKFGFDYIDTVEINHYAAGLEKFHLYELVLKK